MITAMLESGMSQWASDGTQDPVPPPVLSDPVVGLVGTRHEQESVRVRVVEPPPPDISEVRKAMRNVLGDQESELFADTVAETPDGQAKAAAGDGGDQSAGAAPPAEQEPVIPAQSTGPPRAVEHPDKSQEKSPEKSPDKSQEQGAERPAAGTVASRASGGGSGGFGISPAAIGVILLLLVMAVLGVIALASLVDTITSLFD